MSYFVTGATGFIGRHLLQALLERGGEVYVLVRAGSSERLGRLVEKAGAGGARIHPVVGDIAEPDLGLARRDLDDLRGRIDHFFHLAAIYDMNVDDRTAKLANVEGTRHAIDVARALGVQCFHHVSSIAVAGRYPGRFLESMLDEGQPLEHPYFESKFLAEKLVREISDLPYRIYRPGIVVGHSRTGAMDRINGPYYVFKLVQRLRDLVPRWVPLVGVEGGVLPIVPVDFVAESIDYLAHAPGLDGKTFHVVDSNAHRVGEVLNILCRAAGGPEFALHVEARDLAAMVPEASRGLVELLGRGVLAGLGIPPSVMDFVDYRPTFDTGELDAALTGSGIRCPRFESYACKIWDYWEQHMDSNPGKRLNGHGPLTGKVVVVTGASSGIGLELAKLVAAYGGRALLVAHDHERLEDVAREIRGRGGDCAAYTVDLRDLEACDRLVEQVLAEHGKVDALVNNAGKSIRRSIDLSYHRFHDFERTMQLNYYAPVRLILGFLPAMRARKDGHILNVSTIGTQAGGPRFASYLASKAALDAFTRTLAAEVLADNVHVTTVHMPLVRTPMIAPTEIYRYAPALSAEEAAAWVMKALLTRQRTVSTMLGTWASAFYTLAPAVADQLASIVYRIVPESAAAKGERGPVTPPAQATAMQAAATFVSHLLRGVYV
jgi:thioester reductase-like protein